MHQKNAVFFRVRIKERRISPSIPYGYYVKPDSKESGKAVNIYQLVTETDGYGVTRTADILAKNKILIPKAYAEIYYPEDNRSFLK